MGKNTMRLLCASLSLAMVYWLAEGTLSKTDAKKGATKKLEEKKLHSDKNVQDRGLVVVDPKAKDIILEHKSYCSKKMKERHFSGDVLGYITPWNNHGYDIAKIFGNKFTLISPVWLQVKRRGKERFQFTGLHDADQGWMKDVRKTSKNIKIVPRILFDGWTYQDFESVFGSEDEIEELSKNMVLLAKNENFDGFVVEVWSQLGNQKQMELIHLLTHLSEALHEAQLKLILVIPPAVAAGTNQPGMFTKKEFDQLASAIDSFSLMTYDYSAPHRPGPNSPLPWVRACVEVLDPDSKWRNKILLGLNFYGMDYSALGTSGEPILGSSNKIQRTEETAHCGKIPVTREENSQWNPNQISHDCCCYTSQNLLTLSAEKGCSDLNKIWFLKTKEVCLVKTLKLWKMIRGNHKM
uniref:Chitinase domain-containing protein 1 n=1 Tax=Taeniopygia guttata TaxID=59729 RepID=A0A674HUZ6_TAEGU